MVAGSGFIAGLLGACGFCSARGILLSFVPRVRHQMLRQSLLKLLLTPPFEDCGDWLIFSHHSPNRHRRRPDIQSLPAGAGRAPAGRGIHRGAFCFKFLTNSVCHMLCAKQCMVCTALLLGMLAAKTIQNHVKMFETVLAVFACRCSSFFSAAAASHFHSSSTTCSIHRM